MKTVGKIFPELKKAERRGKNSAETETAGKGVMFGVCRVSGL